ncbi:MAG: glycosyltransferase [Thermodesulfobacteriota bacterium]
MTSSLRIIVTGLIAQHPKLGGVTWDYIQYPVGLARIGHDVYYFEDSGEWPYNLDGGPSGRDWVAHDPTPNVSYLSKVMSRFGLSDKWAYHFPIRSQWYGLSDTERNRVIESADLLINVSGTLENPEKYSKVRQLAYIDSDPVFTQIKLMKCLEDFRRRVNSHYVHFSFGENLSEEVPKTGHKWIATRQPILLSEWRMTVPKRNVFTTVMSWTSYKPIDFNGKYYCQKDVELKRFIELPNKVSPTLLELALSKTHHVDWETNDNHSHPIVLEIIKKNPKITPRELLSKTGWLVVEATEVCSDLDYYRSYIESSKAEWSVAKHGYLVGKPGWFSCRSACYLAAGRPVVVQDTGFKTVLPVGEGILTFNTIDDAICAIREVESNYSIHSEAARSIAEDYFDSDKVLNKFLEQAMI